MKQTIKAIEDFPSVTKPVVLTIGNFDGVHPGHQHVIESAIDKANECSGEAAVLTFNNHPSSVLRPTQPSRPLCSLEHKVKLINDLSIDYLLLLTFTKDFSLQSPREFLTRLRDHIPFSHLILGHDSRIGKDRSGDQKKVTALADEMGFTVDYCRKLIIDNVTVSSSAIRKLVVAGELKEASRLLGRPYSIYATVVQGQKMGSKIGFPTANLDVTKLCLPPFGVYAVQVHVAGSVIHGVANLGIAPTVRSSQDPILEVFLLDTDLNLYGEAIEVVFVKYLRPEIKFTTVSQLQDQINIDIKDARAAFI